MNKITPSEVAELSIEQLAIKENLLSLKVIMDSLQLNAKLEEDYFSLYLLKMLEAHLCRLKSEFPQKKIINELG